MNDHELDMTSTLMCGRGLMTTRPCENAWQLSVWLMLEGQLMFPVRQAKAVWGAQSQQLERPECLDAVLAKLAARLTADAILREAIGSWRRG